MLRYLVSRKDSDGNKQQYFIELPITDEGYKRLKEIQDAGKLSAQNPTTTQDHHKSEDD